MKYIFSFLILGLAGCDYISPDLERAVEKEAVNDIEQVADNVVEKTQNAQKKSKKSKVAPQPAAPSQASASVQPAAPAQQ